MFESTNHHGFLVLDANGALYGIVTLSDVERAITQKREPQTVADVTTTNLITAFPDETLEDALAHFGAMDVGRIPVVDRSNPRRVVGLLRRANIIGAYSRALARSSARSAQHEQVRLEAFARTELLQFHIDPGNAAAYKRIAELNLPSDSVIVAVRRADHTIVPRGNTLILPGDFVIVLAERARHSALHQLFDGSETVVVTTTTDA